MSPTIVLPDGRPLLALGSPGGSTIITTVLQILVNRSDFGMTLPQALAAPRASRAQHRPTQAEPAFIDRYGAELTLKGHAFRADPRDRRGDRHRVSSQWQAPGSGRTRQEGRRQRPGDERAPLGPVTADQRIR